MNIAKKMINGSILDTPRKISIRRYILFLILLIMFYLEKFSPSYIMGSVSFIYIVTPIIYISVIFLVLSFPKLKYKAKIRCYYTIIWWTALFGGIQIMIMMLGGVVVGFGKSPYSHSITGIVTNSILIFAPLIAREMIRSYLVNGLPRKHGLIRMSIIVLIMTLTNLQYNSIPSFKTKLDIIQYIGQNCLTELSSNILSTYLVYLGGALPSIIYSGIGQSFLWFMPILPNLSWVAMTVIGTLCPIFCLMFIQYIYSREVRIEKERDMGSENPIGWIITCIISVSIIWFAAGVFPIHPSVIATGSMEPLIHPGDMVLVRKVTKMEDLYVGDVVQYRKENVFIFHRIIEIVKTDKGTIEYRTKGDNNPTPDSDLVMPQSVKGKVVKVLPRLGWPTLLLRSRGTISEEGAQF